MRTIAALAIALSCVGTLACGDKSQSTPAPSASPAKTSAAKASASPTAEKSASPAPSASAPSGPDSSAAPDGSAAPSAGGGDLKTLFSGAPPADLKDSETVVHAGGLVLGFPEGWKSGNVKDTLSESTGDIGTAFDSPPVSGTILGAMIFCETAPPADPMYLHLAVAQAKVQKEKWTEEVDGTVGAAATQAKIGKGTGEQLSPSHEPVVAYYVRTKIAGTEEVLCVGAYPASHPELDKDVVLAFKGLKKK